MTNTSNNRKSIPSPCIGKCCLDNNDTCLGCYRMLPEITGWLNKSQAEKHDIISRCTQRKLNADNSV